MSRWTIEKSGTGIEKSGTGIEKSGTGIEKSGTGIEKSGTGIEKSGTGNYFAFYLEHGYICRIPDVDVRTNPNKQPNGLNDHNQAI